MGELTRRQLFGTVGSAHLAQESTSTVSGLVPPTMATTTTTIAATPSPDGSPLLLVALGVAGLATILVLWRARRMGNG